MCRKPGADSYDLYGIVSAGNPCSTSFSGYAIYTDVSQFTSWIRDTMNSDQGMLCVFNTIKKAVLDERHCRVTLRFCLNYSQ